MKKFIFLIAVAIAFGGVSFAQTKTNVPKRKTLKRTAKPAMTSAQLMKRLNQLQRELEAASKKQRSNRKKGFMTAETTASGLTYVITKQGDGAQLKAGDNIIVNYTGMLTNGQKFDSSLDRGEPFTFPLGAGKVIKGWDEGFQKLRIGDHAILTIPPAVAYGSRGAGGVIPPDATLIFVVEVLGVK